MAGRKGLEVVRPGSAPPCLRTGGLICRGCPGWEAMVQAASEGGPWAGAMIHCACSGLSLCGAGGAGRAR